MTVTPQRTDIDLEEFRKLLIAEREELLGLHHEQRRDMLEEATGVAEGELSTADFNEPADIAAPMADHDRDAAMDANVLGELHEIDRALDRIEGGSYGICIATGKPIPVERLRALPWATMTAEAAEQAIH